MRQRIVVMCDQRAVLFVTTSVKDTSTNVARRRIELACGLPDGHTGEHHDPEHNERWAGVAGQRQTLLRQEDEPEEEALPEEALSPPRVGE
jgi:hypothetical protein